LLLTLEVLLPTGRFQILVAIVSRQVYPERV
jgi:hypothetical protein